MIKYDRLKIVTATFLYEKLIVVVVVIKYILYHNDVGFLIQIDMLNATY